MTTPDPSVPAAHHEHPTRPDAATPATVLVPPGNRLDPGTDFPEDLTGLDMTGLQVLHSRVTPQLDHDYLVGSDGPHPTATDRLHELVTELDTRDNA